LEIQISQDIRKFKTKDVGNFSFKEAGFIVLGLGVGFLTYKIFGKFETAIIPMGVVLVFGFFKPYGMSFLQFIRTVGKETLTPQCYINETDFEYNFDDFEELYGKDVVIPTDLSVIQTTNTVKINKKDKAKILR